MIAHKNHLEITSLKQIDSLDAKKLTFEESKALPHEQGNIYMYRYFIFAVGKLNLSINMNCFIDRKDEFTACTWVDVELDISKRKNDSLHTPQYLKNDFDNGRKSLGQGALDSQKMDEIKRILKAMHRNKDRERSWVKE